MALQDGVQDPKARSQRRAADAGIAALNQAARRLGELTRGRQSGRTRDIVGLLLAHGSRAWRGSQPRCTVRLRVHGADGTAVIRLALG